ncbi:PREDICTED: ADP-ribosyl cyclase/cyclic ADP-ribose hydrolase-like [Acropora digitifera]|uniref:ADP-ribosyl cyclase/cyclic ADP-ribose hydrolase-like n=1 Tax=Acropora digitifera TaxID=70779 RepID=UPI00077A05B0|nr:PREDICTED: ADP-ribosyl cyclase/cyclic ADP-ribose hydrolase-like [Acropora digitifera]
MDRMIRFCLVLIIFSLKSPSYSNCAERSNGSTRHLKDIVLGRCWDFIRQKRLTKNCSTIWNKFYTAFAHKDSCKTTRQDYKAFFDEVGMDTVKQNKSLFWSGTYRVAHAFSEFGARFTTLEDTMAGWIVNGLNWCGSGKNGSDGINYTECPKGCDIVPFWEEASSRFALNASGVVRVLLNGSNRNASGFPSPAYRKSSFFAQFELPNMRPARVTKLLVLVMHTIGSSEVETCGNGSIKVLLKDAKRYNLTPSCHDDPDDVEHLLCVDHPYSYACQFLKEHKHKEKSDWDGWQILAIAMSTVVAVFLIGAVFAFVISKKGGCSPDIAYERNL